MFIARVTKMTVSWQRVKKLNYKISELLVGIDLHIVGLLEQTASVVEVGNSILIWSSQLFLV